MIVSQVLGLGAIAQSIPFSHPPSPTKETPRAMPQVFHQSLLGPIAGK